jgi:hypothetical protein
MLGALLSGACTGSSGSGQPPAARATNRPSPAAGPATVVAAPEPEPGAATDETRKAWEALRYEAAESPAPGKPTSAASIAPGTLPPAAPPPAVAEQPTLSPMEEAHARAKQLEPKLDAAASLADGLDKDARWFHEKCYSLYAQANVSKNGSPEPLDTSRAPGNRAFFALWAGRQTFGWTAKWTDESRVSAWNSNVCHDTWSRLEQGARDLSTALQGIEDDARKQQVLPGDLRDIYTRRGFDRWDEALQR